MRRQQRRGPKSREPCLVRPPRTALCDHPSSAGAWKRYATDTRRITPRNAPTQHIPTRTAGTVAAKAWYVNTHAQLLSLVVVEREKNRIDKSAYSNAFPKK